MSIIRHFDATPAEREAYLKQSGAMRRAATGEEVETEPTSRTEEAEDEVAGRSRALEERYAEMGAAEQFILTITENGYGKRSSSYEYRITGRGGKGIRRPTIDKIDEIGNLVAAFPVEEADQIMLITDGGQTIRLPVGGDKPIRIVSRGSQGVIVFDTAEGEKVCRSSTSASQSKSTRPQTLRKRRPSRQQPNKLKGAKAPFFNWASRA